MNFNQLMKQAQMMQKKLDKIKKEYDEKEIEFKSADDAISGKINGHLQITSLSINEELINMEDKEMLEDLIMLTINDAIKRMNNDKEKAVTAATGGVNTPGLF